MYDPITWLWMKKSDPTKIQYIAIYLHSGSLFVDKVITEVDYGSFYPHEFMKFYLNALMVCGVPDTELKQFVEEFKL